jgi:hypothetical protein
MRGRESSLVRFRWYSTVQYSTCTRTSTRHHYYSSRQLWTALDTEAMLCIKDFSKARSVVICPSDRIVKIDRRKLLRYWGGRGRGRVKAP